MVQINSADNTQPLHAPPRLSVLIHPPRYIRAIVVTCFDKGTTVDTPALVAAVAHGADMKRCVLRMDGGALPAEAAAVSRQ